MSTSTNETSRHAPLSTLRIDLDAIAQNYLSLQKRLKRGCDAAAAVKADAYGLGAGPVADILHQANCRHFYVADIAEGIALRKGLDGREAQIYALQGPWGSALSDASHHAITPVLNSLEDVHFWTDAARAAGKRLPAVLHLDTGMNRLGLRPRNVETLATDPSPLKALDIRYVMSHLACADHPSHPMNATQLGFFLKLTRLLNLPCPLSLANSSGIFLGEEYHFDQTRPGAAIYGINPQPDRSNPMQSVVTLTARILQVRDVDRGESVGYAADYVLPAEAKLATISAGYADGLLRSLAGLGKVYIQGKPCPILGRISMDAIVADVTGLALRPGDEAEILGAHQSVDDFARTEKTIGYEILTALGARHQRIYART